MLKITKSHEKNRRYTNPEILYDMKKSKLYYLTSSIREFDKYLRGEVKVYTFEEVFKDLEEMEKNIEYKNA